MKDFPKILVFLMTCLVLSSCVTTREQLNEQRGIVEDSEPKPVVQSEELQTKEKKTEVPVTVASSTPVPTPVPAQTPVVSIPAPIPAGTPAASPVAGATPAVSATPAIQAPYALPTVAPSATPILKPDTANYGVDELRAELARVSGIAEELQHEKQLKEQAQGDELKKSQERIVALEKQLKDLTPDTPKLPEGKSPFEAGKDAFSSNNSEEAIMYFTQVLSASESGKEAEEATYLRGESYYKKQQYNKAIVDYSRFPEKYQKSSFHPKALLRIAECFEAMGRRDDAKAFYSDLMEKFPKTAEGKIAKKRTKTK
jgi:hypothetical protein